MNEFKCLKCSCVIPLSPVDKYDDKSVLCDGCVRAFGIRLYDMRDLRVVDCDEWEVLEEHYKEAVVNAYVEIMNLSNGELIRTYGYDLKFRNMIVNIMLEYHSEDLPDNRLFLTSLKSALLTYVGDLIAEDVSNIMRSNTYADKFLSLSTNDALLVHEILYRVREEEPMCLKLYIKMFIKYGVDGLRSSPINSDASGVGGLILE